MFCKICGDVVQLTHLEIRECSCGNCRGRYAEDKFNIEVVFGESSNARIVGISNGFMMEQDRTLEDLEHLSYKGTMFQSRKSFIVIVYPFTTGDCKVLKE